MPNLLHLGASDRVLVLAPHPDDESIACGGLLLAARDAGAARSVVVVTDGDNNPWPQRWIEKRWRIDAAARARWGARRRAEAGAALDILGVDACDRHFLGLPDSGLTALLMRDGLSNRLRAQFERFRPTHVALPALHDRHPDHSAVYVGARLALGAGAQTQVLAYAIHASAGQPHDALVRLGDDARAAKRAAILSHETQMRLSGGRFLRFASGTESFDFAPTHARDDLPLRAIVGAGAVELRIACSRLRDPVDALRIVVALDTSAGERVSVALSLAAAGEAAAVEGDAPSSAWRTLRWQREQDCLVLRLPVETAPDRAFFKLDRRRARLVIYDRYGWQLGESRHH